MSTDQLADAPGLALPTPDELAGTWIIDAAHSVVQFSVRHMTIARLASRFDVLDGSVAFTASTEGLSATVTADVDVSSVSSGHPRRNELITSEEFLDVVRHPVMSFLASVGPDAGRPQFTLNGDITLKGVARGIELEVEYGGFVEHRGAKRLGYSARGVLDRREFGLGFDARLPGGGLVVSNRVDLELQIELVKSP